MSQYIGLTALVVRDYDEALRFFVGTLGFELIHERGLRQSQPRLVRYHINSSLLSRIKRTARIK